MRDDTRMTFDSFSSRRIVHRECPSGTGPQASSISRASTRPSTLRLALSEFMLLLNSVTASTPPFMYFATVFVTVARQTPFDLALCSWVRIFPCASSMSRSIWHLQRIVFDVAFLRVGQRIEGDANDKLFFRPLKNRPRSLGANGRLTAIIRHIIGEY